MARAYQKVKYVNRSRTKKNGKSKGKKKKIVLKKYSRKAGKGRVTVKRGKYSGRPSKAPNLEQWGRP